MPRPTNKAELLSAAATGYAKLTQLIADLDPTQRDAQFGFDDRDHCVRDVIAHLVAWHQLMLTWYADGMAERKPVIPAPGYTWKTTPELNAVIWAEAQTIDLDQALAQFADSHTQVVALINQHSDEELFTKKHYRWTGTTSLGAYLVSSTSSHYDWAMVKLRKAIRSW